MAFSAATMLLVTSCSDIPPQAYTERGSPQSLLDVSSEVVTVQLQSRQAVAEVENWLDAVEQALNMYGVDYEWIPARVSEVNLIYERVIAHDCENRFIDNRINPYNMHYPTYGCSIASNMVSMVTDRREFVNPALLGPVDGLEATKVMNGYRQFDAAEYYRSTEDVSEQVRLSQGSGGGGN